MPRGFLGGWSQARGGVLEGTSNQASDGHRGLIRREGGMPVPFEDGWDARQLWGWRGGVSLQIRRQTRNPKGLRWPPVEHACVTLKTGGGWVWVSCGGGGTSSGGVTGKEDHGRPKACDRGLLEVGRASGRPESQTHTRSPCCGDRRRRKAEVWTSNSQC